MMEEKCSQLLYTSFLVMALKKKKYKFFMYSNNANANASCASAFGRNAGPRLKEIK